MSDWNNDDSFMDYLVFKQCFEEDGDVDNDDFESVMLSSNHPEKTQGINFRLIRENLPETTQEILNRLVNKKATVEKSFIMCVIGTQYHDDKLYKLVFEDFWMFAFIKQLSYSKLQIQQKEQIVQLLMDAYSIDYPISASGFYKNMIDNAEFYQFIMNRYGISKPGETNFWKLLALIVYSYGADKKQMVEIFIKVYSECMIHLEEYLKRMFSGCGFGKSVEKYLNYLLDYVLIRNYEVRGETININDFQNPLLLKISNG
ncbi:hypothetical protein DWZ83_02440 [Amedibacillus dolichus]|uniref:Uncharacterized protein n=1 Tax=Amedibacillus dolichus TaxID=31971 RepID=A0A415PPI4_9FIRM|nr:hypothetical protein [Amedibacillus dolichus]RHM14506.1 hypothetical protein DWZ83_02440 [Amedibacillus dolichus]